MLKMGLIALSTCLSLGTTAIRCDKHLLRAVCADGKQFLVDEGVGLACVPEQYRNEVAAQLEVMQRLAAAALNRK